MFDTKIAIVIREDLAVWQKLNVTAFLTSGIVGASEGLLGEEYEDAAGNTYNPLAIQPMIVLGADADTVRTIYHRAMKRGVRLSLYIEDMFKTGHDAANRETVKRCRPEEMNVVGLALREDKKVVDTITRNALDETTATIMQAIWRCQKLRRIKYQPALMKMVLIKFNEALTAGSSVMLTSLRFISEPGLPPD